MKVPLTLFTGHEKKVEADTEAFSVLPNFQIHDGTSQAAEGEKTSLAILPSYDLSVTIRTGMARCAHRCNSEADFNGGQHLLSVKTCAFHIWPQSHDW